jgi:arylsulfatase A-like enzyme
MDEQLGRLRAELQRLGIAQNTMLWFCSDNGPARQGSPRHVGSNGGLSGYKLSLREGGIRVPGLLVWPEAIGEPATIDAPAVTSDYFPTVLDVLGIPLPDDRIYDGISLLPLLRGERERRGSPLGFLNQNGAGEMVSEVWMEDRFKLYVEGADARLFDLVQDPAEETDLSHELPHVAARMHAELAEWKKGVLQELARVTEEDD